MAKKKFYAVVKGHNPGIYDNWPETQAQVSGFSGAVFKGFPSKAQAGQALENGWQDGKHSPNAEAAPVKETVTPDYEPNSISVDAACSGNPGEMEYQGVHTGTGKLLFKSKVYPSGTNNIGEFLALVEALQFANMTSDTPRMIYSDSVSAIAWVRNRRIKSNLELNADTADLWNDVEDAIRWLHENPTNHHIEKWHTKDWGESKADFGRK